MPNLLNKCNSLVLLLLACLVLSACAGADYSHDGSCGGVDIGTIAPVPNGNLWAIDINSRKYEGVFLMDQDGRVKKWICRYSRSKACGGPAYSPDGKWLALYMHGDDDKRNDIFLANLSTGKLRRLTDSPNYDSSPVFSEDGTKVFFSRHKRVAKSKGVLLGGGDIYYVDLATGKVHQVTHHNLYNLSRLAVLPGDRAIIFEAISKAHPGHSLWKVYLDDPGRLIPATPDLSRFARDPRSKGIVWPRDMAYAVIERPKLSLNGRYLTFSYLNPDKRHDWYQVYVTDLKTKQTRQLTGYGAAAFTGADISMTQGAFARGISPDGEWIWFESFIGGKVKDKSCLRLPTRVYRIRRDGTGLKALVLDFSAMKDKQPLIKEIPY